MPRTIELGEDTLAIRLSVLTSIASFKRKIVIPYKFIARVETVAPNLQSLIRLGGTSIGDIQEGHFWHGEDWYFLSYEHPDKVISLTLNDYYIGDRLYKVIVVGVDSPQDMKALIEAKLDKKIDRN
ncbi:hypothetical protein C7445_11614 [Alicyclobacillus sacchari]|uniref:PH (Pleckstrin Homology) domain-containing protein n=1 Tax=Alicyclobacillus sacchari TaxID=392010 RepID=A0A4R8LGP9_9BACL|nr:hypothetical protein [Alicyclobacillus sacchari]TDY42336.1 hypothetical protein C7445_11614 [Alicyclobacillus sacchari]GMA58013.1 hypothetical protein GCM10025858_25160 [Alicyclobacillus sacchari]